jgi:hypothetical protein
MKQYIGISRDHSGSMSHLKKAAMADYNNIVSALKTASDVNKIDTIVNVVSHQGSIKREVVNSSVNSLKPLTNYPTPGTSTPLFDSVETLIDMLSAVPDAGDSDTTFLVMAVTDGQDNSSKISARKLSELIRRFQMTDRWTFVFRVPRNESRSLASLGIPLGNIQEWDQTEYGLRAATEQTQDAITNYYKNVSRGIRSTGTFYADLSHVNRRTADATMENISKKVKIFPVNRRSEIENFIVQATGDFYKKGEAFYQLSKTEKAVQDYKVIAIRNKQTGAVYAGPNARVLLNLPDAGTVKLAPGDHGEWDIFIQSTSTNRVLLPGTSVLYWRNPNL